MARKKTTKIKKEDMIKHEIAEAEKGDVMDLVKAREVRLEYISSPEKKTLAHLARMYQVPLEAIKAIAKDEKWDVERNTYMVNSINEMKGELKYIKAKSELNTVIKGGKLQNVVFDSIMKNIEKGQYFPTVKDFATLAEVVSNAGGEKTSQTGVSNQILNVIMNKPPEEMTYEELQTLENEIRGIVNKEDE